METFPRTVVGGISLPRLLIGSNWFNGYSHTSLAKDIFIKEIQTREHIAEILKVFLEAGVDAIMTPPHEHLEGAIRQAEDATGKAMIRILTPIFNLTSNGDPASEPEAAIARCKQLGAAFCLPHQAVTDALLDRRAGVIRDLDTYTTLIRQYQMIPGLSTHMPEAVIYADRQNADVETYIQLYNAAGFLMQVEADWVMKIIQHAKKPVMTIKPLAAGRLLPVVGLAFVWSTIRPVDMVTIGVTTALEAQEVIQISLDLLANRTPDIQLQKTRSKSSLS